MSGADDAKLLRLDEDARARALDVARSFLVQAPAGSGKTELLIQRFLALLGRTDEPERILALTFTRKAAGEMRERVLVALDEAKQGRPVEPGKPHLVATRALADAALTQDRARGWALTEHPARLRIVTFDSLTTWIVRSAPFSAGLDPAQGYAEDAKGLYAEAAAAAIAGADAGDAHWRRLLAHVRNDADALAKLVAKLLAKRDQLLRQVGDRDAAAVRTALDAALEQELEIELALLKEVFPRDLAPEIARLARYAAKELAADETQAARAQQLAACADCGALPSFDAAGLAHWRALAWWLLTNEGEVRAAVNVRNGFPAAGKGAGKEEREEAKKNMLDLLARIGAVPGLAATLSGVATMPPPGAIGADAWEVVEALLAVMPRARACLDETFARAGEVDFTQASLGALRALGEEDAPSDLLLRLDYRLAHLLVDEFQDTSATQLEVLRRLTAGWTPGEDGRTIFAVGDPMQSIYRFREAEVRLFVEAQQERRIGDIPVECLTLRRNFRSQRGIVEWVNGTFPRVLGSVSDPTRGAVAFEPATAVHAELAGEACTLDLCADPDAEAQAVVARVRKARQRIAQRGRVRDRDDPPIAILVRARTHLERILPALREADIPFAAVELDTLGDRQAVQDLASLTHALLQPGDRLAWLAVLRAPWCGLALPDLVAIAQVAPPGVPIPTVLADPALTALLSEAGRARLSRAVAVLAPSLESHGRAKAVARVRAAWLALGGPACLADALDLDSAQRYFEALAEHERAGDVPDWDVFVAALGELRASSQPAQDTPVQVMTMHKAKGLEFDTVILPGLGRMGRGAAHELLRWRERTKGLLIAPSKAPGAEDDPVFAHLKRVEKEESAAELGRLLYVACTRAKSHLHLIAAPTIGKDKSGAPCWRPVASSSLTKLAIGLAPPVPPEAPAAETAEAPATSPRLLRVPPGFAPQPDDGGLAPATARAKAPRHDVPFDWAQERARVIGTLAHRLLARVGEGGQWDAARIAAVAPRVRADLAGAGFGDDEVDAAAQRVLDAVRQTLADARGCWIFDPQHADARSEWGVAGVDGGEIVHVVLDRTFVVDGERWIVDFKTGTHEGGNVEGFLASEAERYRDQLQRYGRLVRALDGRPVRLALYYPLVAGGFREIAPA